MQLSLPSCAQLTLVGYLFALVAIQTKSSLHHSDNRCQSCLLCQRASIRVNNLAGSYGSTKRYKSVERLAKVNSSTAIGAGGELSDFNYIKTLLEELATEDFTFDDGIELTAQEASTSSLIIK